MTQCTCTVQVVTCQATPPSDVRVLRAPTDRATIWPGEYVEVTLPNDLSSLNGLFTLERCVDPTLKDEKLSQFWPSHCIITSASGKIHITNPTSEPRVLKKNEQFRHVRPITIVSTTVLSRTPHYHSVNHSSVTYAPLP